MGSLGVAAAGLQVCPCPPASATRRLPPGHMQSISGSVIREGHEAGGMWPRGSAPRPEGLGCRWMGSGGAVGRGAAAEGMSSV